MTTTGLAGRAPRGVPWLFCDEVAEGLGPGEAVRNRSAWNGAAYMMFTSGTTGLPKPVLVGHESLANLIHGMRRAFEIGPDSRVSHVAAMHFDPSWQQIGCALTSGAALFPVSDPVRADPAKMAQWLTTERISHCSSVPSLWHPLVTYLADHRDAPRPRLLVQGLGGEALNPGYIRTWHTAVDPSTLIVNVYGPIEATVTATVHQLRGRTAEAPLAEVPIGRPLPNVRAYVLDENLNACPAGVTGQLYLGGGCLAAGYFGASSATASVFLPDPFAGTPGARMYATGDRARLLLSGDLRFEGRVDHLVKVNGVRIELGEIESLICSVPGVTEAAAVVSAQGDQVIGFFSPAGLTRDQEIYAVLAERLAPSSLPARLIAVEVMPHNSAGKIDRAELADRAERARAPGPGPSGPVPDTFAGQTLARIWSEVLGLSDIGADDNFFAIGGDSIASIVVRDRALEAGLRLGVLDLFRAPTIRKLAAIAQPAAPAPAAPAPGGPVPAQAGAGDRLPLLPGQRTIYFSAAGSAEPEDYCAQETYRITGLLLPDCLESAVNVLVERHPALRASFAQDGDQVWQQVTDRPRLRVSRYEAGARDADDVLALVRAEALERVRLDSWPLFDISVAELSPGQSVLVWTIHHVFLDGWSYALLRSELFRTYLEIASGRFTGLEPAGADRYLEHLAQVTQSSSDQGPGHSEEFWREYLSDARPVRLPRAGGHGPAGQRFDRACARIDEHRRRRIAEIARQSRVPENTVIIAALLAAIRQISGSDDTTILYVTSGRAHFDGSLHTVGCLINTLPLRVRAPGGLDLTGLVPVVAQALERTRPHESTSLATICSLTGSESVRDLSEVLFIFQNYPDVAGIGDLAESQDSEFAVTGYSSEEPAQLPITVTCQVGGDELVMDLNYWTSVFSRRTMDAVLQLFLDAIAVDDEDPADPAAEAQE